ncbi:MAG TPA: hypothetical protein VJN64_02605 [Terriglobales bacterium]|nr:hypothetical protein [Terriglobales bacterium]
MLLWVILLIGWAAILILAVSVFRLAGYAEKKMRGRVRPVKVQEDQQAA